MYRLCRMIENKMVLSCKKVDVVAIAKKLRELDTDIRNSRDKTKRYFNVDTV